MTDNCDTCWSTEAPWGLIASAVGSLTLCDACYAFWTAVLRAAFPEEYDN